MKIYKILILSLLLVYQYGCALGPAVVYRPINLIYPKDNIKVGQSNSQSIYLIKPDTSVLKTVNTDVVLKSNPNIRLIIVDNNNNRVQNTNINGKKIIGNLGFNISYADNDPADWLVGAIGSEFQAIGYNVTYKNALDITANNAVSVKVNKLYSSLNYNPTVCRANIDLDFTLMRSGNVIKTINLANEADFPEYTFGLSMYNCNSAALRDTLSQMLTNAIPLLSKSIDY